MKNYENLKDSPPLQGTEAGAVAAIVEQHSNAHLHQFPMIGVPVIVLPKTGEVKSLESLLAFPRRPRAAITVRDHQSFIEYVQRHRGPGTIIFCEVTEAGGSFTAIIDYHIPNKAEATKGTQPSATDQAGGPYPTNPAQWGEHTCKYVCEFTPEWKRWFGLSGKAQNQTAMALFIEDNLFDIATPEPAKMLEMVKTLEATQGVQFKSLIRLNNGDRSLGYQVQTGAKAGAQGDMEIPEKFRLKFAVFTNGPVYDIDCRFRYNIDGGDLRMTFEIERPHRVIDLALAEARTAIIATIQLPVLLGGGNVARV